ncbi:MAG: sulfatase, partial [Planctomycetota bacterium]|nr:sulfatase [Planctomycetota bacterium]
GDLGCYGSSQNRTPNIDKLSQEGMRFTQFYSSSPVCTPSRASLMTGCYPRRVGMHEDFTGHWVLIPRSRRGLNPEELTVAEALKTRGYRTACIGKWHLGDQPAHLPTRHGFDRYFGIPYSNDMQSKGRGDPPLPLVDQEKVISAPVDQATLTQRYTEETIKFIEANQHGPFFVYLPHTFPHLPLFASPAFKGKSANGRYGDAIEEIDWSTGEILNCLKRNQLSENTLILFTSDNGSNGRNGGSNLPLAGAKGSTLEGGMRVPMIARWPGVIPPGATCNELATTMDVLPTFCRLAGAKLPEKKIDGHDMGALLLGKPQATSAYDAFYYYRRRQLQAIRVGSFKYHLSLKQTFPNWTSPEKNAKGRPARLIQIEADRSEKKDVSALFPEQVELFEKLAQDITLAIGNEGEAGRQQRQARTLESSRPLVKSN